MIDYQRGKDGLIARTDTSTTCRCGKPDCTWTEEQDHERDMIEMATAEAEKMDWLNPDWPGRRHQR